MTFTVSANLCVLSKRPDRSCLQHQDSTQDMSVSLKVSRLQMQLTGTLTCGLSILKNVSTCFCLSLCTEECFSRQLTQHCQLSAVGYTMTWNKTTSFFLTYCAAVSTTQSVSACDDNKAVVQGAYPAPPPSGYQGPGQGQGQQPYMRGPTPPPSNRPQVT